MKAFQATEQSFVDAATNLRVFGSCYLESNKALNNTCGGIQARLMPFFTGNYPVFTRWDGAVVSDEEAHQRKEFGINDRCFTLNYLQGLNGRGIVVSAGDGQVEDTVNLIRVLRGLDNKLPIQVFHKGDLGDDSMAQILNQDIKKALVGQSEYKFTFPQQNVWFVDVRGCIKEEYMKFFNRFSNKFFPYMFGSFDETILMDTDAVPLVKP
ncbi:glycosyltransferase family 71 protein, partial [Babjeviella inositovora NRRL Y-12698]